MATAEPILTQLMNQETISEDEQAYLGVTGRDITSEYASAYGMPEGIYIVEVSDGSPAAKAGLKQGYIITGINGEKVTSMEALQEKLTHIRSGEKGTLTLKVSSNGEYKEVTKEITFGKKQS